MIYSYYSSYFSRIFLNLSLRRASASICFYFSISSLLSLSFYASIFLTSSSLRILILSLHVGSLLLRSLKNYLLASSSCSLACMRLELALASIVSWTLFSKASFLTWFLSLICSIFSSSCFTSLHKFKPQSIPTKPLYHSTSSGTLSFIPLSFPMRLSHAH